MTKKRRIQQRQWEVEIDGSKSENLIFLKNTKYDRVLYKHNLSNMFGYEF
jgi:hypothetical protein